MSKTFIGGAVCRRGVCAEEMLDRVVCSREQLSFQMCLESGDGSGETESSRLQKKNRQPAVQLLQHVQVRHV